MSRATPILALALALLAPPAAAEQLVAELSARQVSIASNFAGDSISLFGVVERDDQSVSRAGAYEVIVVVRGPPKSLLVQRKERRLGVWINAAGESFGALPSYYGLLASRGAAPLVTDDAGPAHTLSLARLGAGDGSREEMRAAIARRRMAEGLYVEDLDAVEMLTNTFFRTEIPLPSVVADGAYDVAIYLYADGIPLDALELAFLVQKVGFEQRVFELSRSEPLLYGLGAVVLGLVTGYVGGVVFRRG